MSGTTPAPAAPTPKFTQPDLFTVAGGGLHVTFSTTGFDGKPHFSYQDTHRVLNFSGDQIAIADVPDLGQVVSVTLARTVDSGSTTFSLLVPRVQIVSPTGFGSVPIHIDGITVQHRFSIIPRLNHGQQDFYTVTPLSGTASFVVF